MPFGLDPLALRPVLSDGLPFTGISYVFILQVIHYILRYIFTIHIYY